MQDVWSEALRHLGGPTAAGPGGVAEAVRRGLPHDAVDRLERDGFTAAELDRLVLPARTYRHRRQRDEALTPAESERALRVAMIAALAEDTFGTAEKAHRWLRRPLARFDGRTPLDMLDTEIGGRAVEDLLHAIGHGLLA
ncbi:antitoxin Xre/MbcA/ParS toxin-binding domain-containing protein [Caenispirillum bisanense]|uniref:Putative toxin-antitoxin system antitoxin component, TIGR02293 family n=1 Tax=Caenispirillum bisanense TaxID=414052 RepID=A0A286GVV9_9PROT|nr:antitoxin Xre/MbcA/ParS toxin-binding domain-containing protein [Caenispirillum bisanense]SOD99675.1 putative toxin-antitoxin system antitoxin component, TIGR02293 family [Caenispirillum bisanense]